MPFTIPNDPTGTSAQSEIFQTDIDILLAGFVGTGVQSGCAVSSSGAADNKVNVALGDIQVGYVRANVAAGTVTLTAPDGTNPRIDLVWVDSTGALGKTDGTAATAPSPPALPASTVVVAMVQSPAAGGNTVQAGWIIDKRVNVDNGGLGVNGDGSDGNVTIGAGTTTLTRDMFYDTLTVPSGATLNSGGFRIFYRTKCDLQAGGVITVAGGDASGATAGTAGSSATTTGGSQAGGAGGVTSGAGQPGGNVTNSAGGQGGNGGTGNGGGSPAGTAGTWAAPLAGISTARMLPGAGLGMGLGTALTRLVGGSGGGGGGGGSTGVGGGGGGGGGTLVLVGRQLVLNGTISAKGGNGANGAAANGGGGGGGGGGAIFLVYSSRQGTGTTTVAGGTHGNLNGTGTNGSDGVAGTLFELVN